MSQPASKPEIPADPIHEVAPTHYAIYVYDHEPPPQGEPTAVSLCPWRRGRNGALTRQLEDVTCSLCLRHIRELGLIEGV